MQKKLLQSVQQHIITLQCILFTKQITSSYKRLYAERKAVKSYEHQYPLDLEGAVALSDVTAFRTNTFPIVRSIL